MRWGVFAIFLLIALTLEMSLKPVFVFNEYSNVSPSFMAVLLVYVSLLAPRMTALWAALLMGLLLDLTDALLQPGGEIVFLIGPSAFGYVLAALALMQMRSVVFRQRLITIVAFTLLAVLIVSLVRIVLLSVRGWFGESLVWGGGSVGGELLRVILVSVYSCVMALPFGWVLQQATRLWAFQSPHARGSWR